MDYVKYVNSFWTEDYGTFPGAQPVSIERKDFDTLSSAEYVMCAKLDGERFFLAAAGGADPVLVNRRMDTLPTDIRFTPYVNRKGVLLDGELVDGVFVIHDAVQVVGRTVKDLPHYERIRIARAAVRMVTAGRVVIKQFFLKTDVAGLRTAMDNCPNDGVVFYPVADPVGCRTQPNFFKWKPAGHHTVDFLVRPRDDGQAELITWKNKRESVYAVVPTPPFPVPGVVEFNTVIEDGKVRFDPVKARPDKKIGNSMFTLTRTILNVKENISFEEATAAASGAKPAPKPAPKPVDVVDPVKYRAVKPGKAKSTLAKEREAAPADPETPEETPKAVKATKAAKPKAAAKTTKTVKAKKPDDEAKPAKAAKATKAAAKPKTAKTTKAEAKPKAAKTAKTAKTAKAKKPDDAVTDAVTDAAEAMDAMEI